MATVTKRGNSYSIRVSCGYDTNGKQVIRSMTWKPAEKMTKRQIEKELECQKVMFENACKDGFVTAVIKFENYAEHWFTEYAEIKLKPQTVRTYHHLSKRVYKAIGHLRLDKITPQIIQNFVTDMTKEKQYNSKGEEIGYLSAKTIKEHVGFISSVFRIAIKMKIVKNNPCKGVTLPNITTKEREVYTLEEVQEMLELFKGESETNFKYVMFFTLAAFTGLRRGELLGLEWKDIDFDNNLISVVRTSAWKKERGIYTDTPKTKSSNRIMKIPDGVKEQLIRYKAWQDNYKESIGSKWIEHDRLFTKINGEPMGLRSPYKYYEKFCKRTGMRFVNVHSFRHFTASILIANHVDAKTVQACLGHNDINTTLQIYAHSFKKAQAMAMDSVADCIYKKNDNGA